ncbi:Sodium/calcium exchanger protein [Spraguea lophii 42_110]|uniref:Sodium/calcium exchanger protein n=1 Tax=Spraguea lophii (strain 42_110) TaxID=1358809 RepID=S7XRW4_SPRLO|nr:Sodium/calcium exchanger protein [Spraguea lophii 42_110]
MINKSLMIYNLIKNAPSPISHILSVLYCIILIFLSCLIADEYMVKYLKFLIKMTNIKSDVAAILFLNIGNGLPDLITSFIAVDRNLSLVFFTVIGSYITLITLVLGLIIIFRKDGVVFNPSSFYKNIGFLFVSYVFLIYLIFEQKIDYILSIAMICMYSAFIFHTIINSIASEIEIVENENELEESVEIYRPLRILVNVSKKFLSMIFLNLEDLPRNISRTIYYSASFILNFWILYFVWGLKVSLIVVAIIHILLIALGFILSKLDQKFISPIFSKIYGFSISMIWIFIITDETFAIIENSEVAFGLPKEFSALTILALGNCMGDIVTGTIASKSGLFQIAATAVLTSPIHNVLFNLPILFLYELIRKKVKVMSFKRDVLNFDVPGALIPIILIVLIFNFEMRNSKMEKELGWTSICTYIIFIVLLICEMIVMK